MITAIGIFLLTWLLAYWAIALPVASMSVVTWLLACVVAIEPGKTSLTLLALALTVLVPVNLPWMRRQLFSRWLFRIMRHALPPISQTEREALDAGNTWWDAELFSGWPNWKILQALPAARLGAEEQAFLDGPAEQLCAMLNDWDITAKRRDLPPQVWDFIKKNKFFGMIIPKRYGGLGFSHFAHSQVVMKIASRSVTAAVTVMVPNSLGPAKLLLAYGTDAQRERYLPRLANGEEIPCFALTGPEAGSDAGAMPDVGIVCLAPFQGNDAVLGIRLNWQKRYITLGPVATLIGLAFKLYDPDHLLGEREDIGITVALIPADTPGIRIGNRHFPLDSAFQNGPNSGKDVFIPIDWVIGGQARIGNGWKMLMQSLATGRGISLPALATGAAKFTCRNVGAYARIRTQFHRPIGEFEGIEEALARMAGETYLMDAARTVSAAALDQGQRPAVISAILKYELTERMRRIVNDGMDILAGSAICLGPRNYLGRLYQIIPVSITVEGANILTRTMMIFGQGAIRCHPFLQKEMDALYADDQADALKRFDRALFGHLGFALRNLAAAFWLGLTNAQLRPVPGDRQMRRYYRQIARLSAAFALVADFALLSLGGTLKRKERISGRFADVLSNLYLCSCALTHFHHQGCPPSDRPLLDWACQHTIHRAQQSLLALFWKLPYRPLTFLLRAIVFPNGKPYAPPDDRLSHQVASMLMMDSPARERLTAGIYITDHPDDATGRIESAFRAIRSVEPAEQQIRLAQRQGRLASGEPDTIIEDALAQAIIDDDEAERLRYAQRLKRAAIAVDEFSPDELCGHRRTGSTANEEHGS